LETMNQSGGRYAGKRKKLIDVQCGKGGFFETGKGALQ